jgi:hypothetical protein
MSKNSGSFPFNATQIKNGKIVKLRKDGTIKSIIGNYETKHTKQLRKKNDR